jgi:hypothetical protein
MNKLQPNELIKLQKVLRRGTIVRVHDQKKDTFIEAIFDGFSDEECPYRYCELHPKNPGQKKDNKPCDGFMKWIIDEKDQKNCPYLGGLEFTAGDQQVIIEIKTKKKNPKTGISEEIWLEPQKYLK